MAATKATTVHHNDVTLTASAADTVSSAEDLTTSYGGVMHVKLTNGATGPTVAAQAQIEVSPDNSHWYKFGGPLVGLTSNNGVAQWAVEIPIGVAYARVALGSNTGQNVTGRAEMERVTAI